MSSEPTEPLFGSQASPPRPLPSVHTSEQPASAGPAEAPGQPVSGPELMAALQRLERLVADLGGRVETLTREKQHRPFSPAWFLGTLLQILVVGFVIAAIADRVFQAEIGQQLANLLLAGVLQLGALTAFLLARD